MDKDKIQIETERLFIRVVKSENVTDEYVLGLNDPQVNKYMFVREHKQTMASVRDFVESNYRSTNSVLLGLFTKNDNRLIGTVRLSGISYFHYFTGLGICLFVKEFWRQGFGCEALAGVRDHVFLDMGFHYIDAGVYAENISSCKLFEKSGFECYERIGDKYRYEEQFVDVLMYRVVNQNFELTQKDKCDEYISSGRN